MKKFVIISSMISLVAIILALTIPVILRAATAAPGAAIEGLGGGAANALRSVLDVFRNSTITINDRVFLPRQEPVLRLSTYQCEFDHEREMHIAWMGSEKVVAIKAHVVANIGFDLKKYCSVAIDNIGRRIVVTLGRPEVLSLEISNPTYTSANGWLTAVNDEDRNRVLAELNQSARAIAASPSYLQAAIDSGKSQIGKLLGGSGYEVSVQIEGTKAPSTTTR